MVDLMRKNHPVYGSSEEVLFHGRTSKGGKVLTTLTLGLNKITNPSYDVFVTADRVEFQNSSIPVDAIQKVDLLSMRRVWVHTAGLGNSLIVDLKTRQEAAQMRDAIFEAQRRRTQRGAPAPAAPAAPAAPIISPDRRFYWDGAQWQALPTALSPDGRNYWDGAQWVPMPKGAPVQPR